MVSEANFVRLYHPPGKDTLMSVDLFFESAGIVDQLSPRKEPEEMRFAFGSALEIGMAAVGIALVMYSCFCFFCFCSC